MKYVGNVQPHYGLRRLSIGVASVLIGIMVTGIVGHADDAAPVNGSKNVSVDTNVGDVNNNASDQVVLQSRQTGDNTPSAQNVEGGGTENQESAGVDGNIQHASNSAKNMYIQSAAENTSYSDSAISNVQGDWIWQGKDDLPTTSHSVSRIIGQTDQGQRIGIHLSFDVASSQLKNGAWLNIAKLFQTSNNSGRDTFASENSSVPITVNGTYLGQMCVNQVNDDGPVDAYIKRKPFKELDYALRVESNAFYSVEGVQHISINAPWLGTLNVESPWSFRGVKSSDLTFTLLGNGGLNKVYRVHYSWPDNASLSPTDPLYSGAWPNSGSFLNDSGNVNPFIWINNPAFINTHGDQTAKFHQTYGKEGRPDLSSDLRYGLHVYANNHNSVILSSQWDFKGSIYLPIFNDQGQISKSTGFGETMLSDNQHLIDIPLKKVVDGLSLSDLKNLNFKGIVASQQTDGSIMMYYDIPLSMFKVDTSKFTDQDYLSMVDNSYYLNYVAKDTNDAIRIAKRMVQSWNNSALQSLIYHIGPGLVNWPHVSDPLSHPRVAAALLDPDTGKVIVVHYQSGTYTNSSIKGQSTVKLHFVNANTGADLAQVKAYTDWPNQGKHVQLSIPTITGYHLETNAPQSILSKFNLSGTALTTNSAVDYPAEDTISDYYFVMTPNDETATVNIIDADEGNKVLSTGTITGKFGQVVSLSSDLQSKLDTLMATGHYLESANDLDGEVTYGDGASKVYTIKLKHKLDSVQRHYRVIEDLPDGSQKVIIDVEATLYKDRDVDYYGERGAYVNGDGTKTLLKSNNVSISTGYVVPGDPSGDNLQSELIDSVPGYSWSFVDQTHGFDHGVQARLNTTNQLALLDIFNGTKGLAYNDFKRGAAAIDPLSSCDFHIKYLKNQYPVIVSYYDQSGHQITTSTKSYDYLTQLDLTTSTPANYVLLTGQSTKLTVGYDHNEIDLLVAPKITQRQEQKIIRRIIEITDPKGLEHDIEQDVVFVRNVYHDNAANSDTEGSWRALGRDHFVAYVPAVVDGYTAQSASDRVALPTDQDQIVKLSYTPFITLPVPKYIDAKGNGYSELPAGYSIVNGQNSESGSMFIIKKPAPVVSNKVEYVTRTITIYMPNGHKRTITQKARKGSKFVQAHLPKLRGYQVQIDGNIDSADANGNLTATVKFVKI